MAAMRRLLRATSLFCARSALRARQTHHTQTRIHTQTHPQTKHKTNTGDDDYFPVPEAKVACADGKKYDAPEVNAALERRAAPVLTDDEIEVRIGGLWWRRLRAVCLTGSKGGEGGEGRLRCLACGCRCEVCAVWRAAAGVKSALLLCGAAAQVPQPSHCHPRNTTQHHHIIIPS